MTEVTIESVPAAAADANARWNFSVNLWDVIFIMFGISLVSRETVMPVLVTHLTDSKLAIGLIPAIYSLGSSLPQLLIANFSERLRYKKPFVMWVGGAGERGGYLLIALVIWLFADTAPTLALTLFFVFLATSAFSTGIGTPPWYDMIAKVIPTHRRGLWSGAGHGLGALMGVAGAYFVGYILGGFPYPQSFVILFLTGFAIMMVSWIGLALNREPPSTTVKARVPMVSYLQQLPALLRRDHNYARFLMSRTVAVLGTMASGFYMVYGIERFQVAGTTIGWLTAILVASQALLGVIWGIVADRWGHKVVLASAALLLMAAAMTAWFATGAPWLTAIFFLLGAAISAELTSSLNITLEFCTPADRPTYIGLTNTLLAPTLALAPLLGGWLATWTGGYHILFLTTAICAAAGALLLLFWVREPRYVGPVRQ
ncbi:MAG: MFS transporter [Caldilineaceae bacterium]|nr:MFS transporter [Caldilineaceae bacterium]